MASPAWLEVDQAVEEKRHELVLSGPDISKRVKDRGLDNRVFRLKNINFLEISRAGLTAVPDTLGELRSLTNLVLHTNSLTNLPPSLGTLTKLKFLDISQNQLEELPESVGQLSELHRLNVNGNSLTSFPDISGLSQLHELDVSHNQLDGLPEGATSPQLGLLAQILAGSNQITELPADLSELHSLKNLDVSDNKLTVIPPELSQCIKLKDFNYRGNKLKDRRLAKMMDQCSTKAVLDYLRNIFEKEREAQGGGKGKGKKGKKKGKGVKDELEELGANIMTVLHFPTDDSGLTIHAKNAVTAVRPYIVCVAIRNLDMSTESNMFKRFIALQTKLHDGVCQKRLAATIATHDLAAVRPPLAYDAKKPADIKLVPLFKQKEVSAERLVAKLRHEAEELRKEKKRNTFSGIHKYLDLIHGKPVYPCLTDAEGVVISFPPITNCELTKVSKDTTDILVEVTSSNNLDTCKKVLDELLKEMLEMDISNKSQGEEAAATGGGKQLLVEQVRILDNEGSMKVVYPARNDLQAEGYKVIRNYE